MLNAEYNTAIKKLYMAKKESDIYAVLDFCETYEGRLGLGQISDLMRMSNENTEASLVQNE